MKPPIHRRKFLHTLACGSAVVGASPLPQSGTQKPASNQREGSSQYTLAIHTGMFRRYRGSKAFSQIRAAGYRQVELSGGQIRSAANSAQAADQLKQRLADAGLKPAAAFVVHRIASSDETERKKAIGQWRQSIDGIRNLGLKLVGTELTGDIRNAKEGEVVFRKSMDELLPYIEEAGFHLSVEPHPGDFFETASPTLQLLRSYDSAHLGYLHCTPHTFFLGESISNVITEAGKLLTHIHLADTFQTKRIMDRFGTGVGLHLHLQPGLGEVDFAQTFKALEQIDYRGYLSMQLLSHVDDPDGSAIAARKYLKKLLGDRLKV